MDIKFAELENKLDDLGKKIDSKFAAFECKLDDLIKKKRTVHWKTILKTKFVYCRTNFNESL